MPEPLPGCLPLPQSLIRPGGDELALNLARQGENGSGDLRRQRHIEHQAALHDVDRNLALGCNQDGPLRDRLQDLAALPCLPIEFSGSRVLYDERRAEAMVRKILENSELLIGYVLIVGRDAKLGDDYGRGERRELERSQILGVFGYTKCTVSASAQEKAIFAFYLDTYRPAWAGLPVQKEPSFIRSIRHSA